MFKERVLSKYVLQLIESKARGFKGANWVKPSFDEAFKALRDEAESRWDNGYADLTKEEFQEVWHLFKVQTFTPSEAKKIDVTDPGNKVPKKWLTDPKSGPKSYSFDSGEFRYNPEHHKDVIPSMRDGTDLDMPFILHFEDGRYWAMGGRHRIVYALNLGLPLKALVIKGKDWFYPGNKKQAAGTVIEQVKCIRRAGVICSKSGY